MCERASPIDPGRCTPGSRRSLSMNACISAVLEVGGAPAEGVAGRRAAAPTSDNRRGHTPPNGFFGRVSIFAPLARRAGRRTSATKRRSHEMRVMVLVKATEESEAGQMPSQKELEQMMAYNEELVKAGVMLAGEGLHPSSRGVRVRLEGGERKVIDGPFAETKELLAGYWLWQVKSMDEAIEWAKRMPSSELERAAVEIRPVFEEDDFGEELTPELREKERELRARVEGDA